MTNIYDNIAKDFKEEESLDEDNSNLIVGNNYASGIQNGPNLYQSFIDQDKKLADLKVKQNLQAVMARDPNRVGEALRLADELGLPQSLSLDSDKAIELMKRKKQEDYLNSLNLARYSPVLHKQLTDPKFAALAYDNIDNLQGLEKLFHDFTEIPENMMQGWEKGRLQTRRGHIGVELQWSANPDQETLDELGEIDARLKELEADGTGPFEEGFAIFGQYSKTLPHAFAKGGAGAVVGGALGSWTGPGSAFTAKGGFVVGFLGSLAYDSWAVESGNSYLSLVDAGFDKNHSKWIATGVGLTSAALEIWGMSIVSAPIRKLLTRAAAKQISKELLKPGGRYALKNFAMNYAKAGLGESATETLQELTQIIGREIAVMYDSREDVESQFTSWEGISEVGKQLAMTFYRTIQGMSVVGLVGGGPTYIADVNKMKNARRQEVFFEALEKQANESKLKERNSVDFQSVTQAIGNEKGITDVYFDAQAFAQSMKELGLDINDIKKVSPTIARQLEVFNNTGTISGNDIVVPIGEYSTKLVGTNLDGILKQHRRFDKDKSFSQAEKTYFQANKDKLEKEATEIANRDANQTKKYRASATKVKKDMAAMLKSSGKFPTRRGQLEGATFYQNLAITLGNRLGILPDEVFKKYPIRIIGPNQIEVAKLLDGTNNQIGQLRQQLKELGPEPTEEAELQNWKTKTDAINDQISDLENEREIFSQQAKPQEQGKLVPQAVFQIARIVENFNFASSKPFATNRDFKIEIQNRVLKEAKKAGIDLSQPTVEVEKYLVQTLLADAQYALIENPNAIGWYNEKVTKAKALLAKIHPELTTDTASNFAFTWALATTSNGIKVDKNFELANEVYSYWKENGTFPIPFGTGKAGRAMTKSFKIINRLIEEKGIEDVEQFMKTTHTVKEVETYTGVEIKDFGKTEIVYGAAVIGPKIGNGIFANLYGNYEQLTLDRWAMRTWGRMTGTLVTDYTKQAKTKRNQLKQYIKALSKEQKKEFEKIINRKLTLGDIDAVAKRIETKTALPANRKLMAAISLVDPNNDVANTITSIKGKPIKGELRIGIGDEIRKAGNSLAGYLDGQKEQPKGPPERRFIEKVFSQVLPVMQQQNPNLTMADLQALVWYPEKKLYDSAKLKEAVVETGYEDNSAPDYANAAASLVATMGISETEIQSTLQEVDNELSIQSEEQSGDTQRDVGESGIVRGTDTFQQQGLESEGTNIDETTGLLLNADGTVTVYHHTSRANAERIKATGELRSVAEPDVYVTTRAIADTGYGNTAVAIRIDPTRLSLDDEFPNGRRDFRLSVGKPRGSIQVETGEFLQQDKFEDSRGGFDPKTLTIFLNQEADISTFFHETAHFMLSVMEDLVLSGQAPPDIQKDFDVLLNFWGVKDVETWSKFDLNQKRQYHESFAYNYEIYIAEEKAAPNIDMQNIFMRFGEYVRNIYKSIRDELNAIYKKENGKDLPVLTEEVKAVMDRMLASEEQIQFSQRVYGMQPMFLTQEQSGMDNKTWQEYTDAIQETQEAAIDILTKASMGQMKWLKNKSETFKKLQKKEAKEIRKQIEAEETAKAEQETIYKLQKFLKKGEWKDKNNNPFQALGTTKINVETIKNLLPFYDFQTEIKQLSKGGSNSMVTKNGGLPVDMVAEQFGFEDPVEMINALVDLEKIEDVIKERTDKRILDEYSDMNDPRQQELALQEALHNEARARFLAIELRFITKTTQPVRFQVAAARQAAQRILRKTRLRDIRPTKYAQNERRARKLLEKAMRDGDDQGVIKAKQSELINSQLAREAVEIHKEVDRARKLFDVLFKYNPKNQKTREMNYVNAAKQILSFYGEGPTVEDGVNYLKDLKNYDQAMYDELSPIVDEGRDLEGREIKDLTAQDFDTLYELIQSLDYQSKRDKQFRTAEGLVAQQKVVDDLVTPLKNMDARPSIEFGEQGALSPWERVVNALEGLKAMLRRVEHWCDSKDGEVARLAGDKSYARVLKDGVFMKKEGDVAGPFTKYIWRTLKDPITKWREERPKWTGRYVDLLAQADFSKGKIRAPELVSKNGNIFTFGRQRGMGKAELLAAMLHTGNKSNLTKLLVGRGWGEIKDGVLDTSKWDAFVDRMIQEGFLTGKDFDFIQGVFNLNKEMLPIIQQAHKDIFGYYFKEVEATPIVNQFGTYAGGYVPAVADPDLVTKNLSLDETLRNIRQEMQYSVPAVERGFTKPRTQVNRALSLNLGLQATHMDNALRFAYIQPAVTDLVKLFNNKEFSTELNRVDDRAIKDMLIPWLRNSASQKSTLGKKAWYNDGINYMTRSTSLNYMFLSLKNGMQQVTGLLPAKIKVEGKYLNDAFKRYTREPHKISKEIAQMSPFMADRQVNQMFDVQNLMNELTLNPEKYEKMQRWVAKHAYFVQQAFQNYVDSVVWIAKYNQVLANAPKTMLEADVQKEAIQQADGAVRMTQDSLLPEDRAAYQTTSPFFNAMFQFSSYFNGQANLNATAYKSLIKELGFTSKRFSGQLIYTFMFGFMLPALVSEAIQELAGGGLVDDDEDGYIDDFFEFGYMSALRYGTSFVPLGNMLMMPINQFDDKAYNDRITVSPSVSLINSTVQGSTRFVMSLFDPDDDISGHEVRSILTLSSLFTRVPTYFIAKPIGIYVDEEAGKWKPRGPIDRIRAYLFGIKGEGRKR